METETVTELKMIRADLDMLTDLYSKLVEMLIQKEKPEDEKKEDKAPDDSGLE